MTALARSIFKSILLILNILIFNNILAQTVPQNINKNNDVRDSININKDSLLANLKDNKNTEDQEKALAQFKKNNPLFAVLNYKSVVIL